MKNWLKAREKKQPQNLANKSLKSSRSKKYKRERERKFRNIEKCKIEHPRIIQNGTPTT